MDVCRECCVLSGRGLCDGLITRPEEAYRLWCVIVCDQETSSRMRRPWPALGCSAMGGGTYWNIPLYLITQQGFATLKYISLISFSHLCLTLCKYFPKFLLLFCNLLFFYTLICHSYWNIFYMKIPFSTLFLDSSTMYVEHLRYLDIPNSFHHLSLF